LISFDFVKVLDSVSRGTELYEHCASFFDGNVPVLLKIKYKLPNSKTNMLRVSKEEVKIILNSVVRVAEIIAKSAERAEDVETTSLRFTFL